MSTVLSNGPSLLVLEVRTIASGYSIFQTLLKSSAKPVEAFATLTGSFVILMNGVTSELRKIQSKLPKKDVLDSALLDSVNDSVLNGFYNLLKNSPRDGVYLLDIKTVPEVFRVAQQATEFNLDIIEIRNARSLAGLSFLIVTGSLLDLKIFGKQLKKFKKIKSSKLVETDSSFRSFFSFP